MITWLNFLNCDRIDVLEFPSKKLTGSLNQLRLDGFRIDFINITTEFEIPVILAVISQGEIKYSSVNYMAFGLGSNLDPRLALMRAYSEALEILVNFYNFTDSRKISVTNRRTKIPQVNLQSYFKFCSFLTQSRKVTTIDRIPAKIVHNEFDELDQCLRMLNVHNIRIYFSDRTPFSLQGKEYYLMRVFASYLQPHLYDLDCWRLQNPRIYSAPLKMGYKNEALNEANLNLVPNPFAIIDNLV
jgi:thiazole/oxazole-forming peptide maturase SagD family component